MSCIRIDDEGHFYEAAERPAIPGYYLEGLIPALIRWVFLPWEPWFGHYAWSDGDDIPTISSNCVGFYPRWPRRDVTPERLRLDWLIAIFEHDCDISEAALAGYEAKLGISGGMFDVFLHYANTDDGRIDLGSPHIVLELEPGNDTNGGFGKGTFDKTSGWVRWSLDGVGWGSGDEGHMPATDCLGQLLVVRNKLDNHFDGDLLAHARHYWAEHWWTVQTSVGRDPNGQFFPSPNPPRSRNPLDAMADGLGGTGTTGTPQ